MPQLTQSTIPSLHDIPRSSSKKQHQTLVLAALKRGLDVHELRAMVGGSLCALSAKDCSDWIKHFSGRDLPNPPGGKPWPYRRRRPSPRHRPSPRIHAGGIPPGVNAGALGRSIPRTIQSDHIEQIGRLMLRYFEGNLAAASAWFLKNWKVKEPRDLLTTARAGEVIRALKDMVARRESPAAPSNPNERLVLSREERKIP
jgi:hypothetical protein